VKVRAGRLRHRFFSLVRQPIFWFLTIGGNVIVTIGALLLQNFEMSKSGDSLSFIDYFLWSMGTVTTVGYGNFVAQTFYGKCTVVVLMAAGTLFVWSYMAFLVTGLIAPELAALEQDVHGFEKELREIKK
jgi:hypothetical protein